MRPDGEQLLVLDCDFFAWRERKWRERPTQKGAAAEIAAEVMAFTFNDVHPRLIGVDRTVVLRPYGGVKS